MAQKEGDDVCGPEVKANESARPYGPVAAGCSGPGEWGSGGG